MNVSDIRNYVYSAAANELAAAANNTSGVTSAGSTVKAGENASEEKASFSAALDEEVTKLSEFKELANALDGSILGAMTKNATDTDLQALSNDLLGSSGGREVLSKLMEGHFNSIVMSDSEDSDENALDTTVDSYNETVSETQSLIDALEKVSSSLQEEA